MVMESANTNIHTFAVTPNIIQLSVKFKLNLLRFLLYLCFYF